jgi:hypothetical protein
MTQVTRILERGFFIWNADDADDADFLFGTRMTQVTQIFYLERG